MGALGGIWEPACLDCPSVHSSIFPNFILLSPLLLFFSPSSSLSYYCLLLWPPLPIPPLPSTLGATARTPCRPSCAKHIRCISAWLLSQHRVSLGLGPPHTASPHPGRSAGPSEAHLLLCPPPWCHQSGFPCSGHFWKANSGLPLAGGEQNVGSPGGLVSLSLPVYFPPTPGPPAVCQLHPRAQAAMTVTVWSCPGQRKGPRRTVALGAWVHGPRLPTVVQSGLSPLVVQA